MDSVTTMRSDGKGTRADHLGSPGDAALHDDKHTTLDEGKAAGWTLAQAARFYLGLCRIPIPVGYKTKVPVDPATGQPMANWEQLRPSPADLDHLFPAGKALNLGLLLGKPSGGLVDADLDAAEAILTAPFFLPPTGWISERAGKPRSHHWYLADVPPDLAAETFKDLDGAMLLELRSTGGHTVAPPSTHESGEDVVWYVRTEPAQVSIADLRKAVARTAAAALVARHWPKEGGRNGAALALAGGLLRVGWSVEEVERFVEAVAVAAKDDEAKKRVAAVAPTKKKQDEDAPTSGWPKLARALPGVGKAVVELLHHWLELPRPEKKAKGLGDKGSIASVLVKMVVAAQAELFHTPDGVAYVTAPVAAHRETWRIRSTAFRRWLARLFFEATEKAANGAAMQDALGVLEGMALYQSPEHPVFARVASCGDTLYLDLADPEWRAVEIDTEGWRVVADPPVRFRRPNGMQPLAEPARGGGLSGLRDFINVKTDQDWLLLLGWAVAALRHQGPFPILVLTGEQGTCKTTLGKMLQRLVDPNAADLRSEPRDVRDLAIAAGNSWLVAYDNLSFLRQWLSDALCRLSTGGGFGTRQLFTDDEEMLFNAKRPALLTSIEDVVIKGDLLDRSVPIQLEPLPEDARRTEADLWAEFDRAAPSLLGALLDAVSAGLRLEPETKLDRFPRMADFAKWAEACLRGAGFRTNAFLDAYDAARGDANALALEVSPVAAVLMKALEGTPKFHGTAAALLAWLDGHAEEAVKRRKAWPSRPNHLTNELRRLAPNLRKAGVEVVFLARQPGTGRRLIEISRGGTDRHDRHGPSPGGEGDGASNDDSECCGDDGPAAGSGGGSSHDRHGPGDDRHSPGDQGPVNAACDDAATVRDGPVTVGRLADRHTTSAGSDAASAEDARGVTICDDQSPPTFSSRRRDAVHGGWRPLCPGDRRRQPGVVSGGIRGANPGRRGPGGRDSRPPRRAPLRKVRRPAIRRERDWDRKRFGVGLMAALDGFAMAPRWTCGGPGGETGPPLTRGTPMNVTLGPYTCSFMFWRPTDGRLFERFAYDVETTLIDEERPSITPDYVLGAACDGNRGVFLSRDFVLAFFEAHQGKSFICHNAAFDLKVTAPLLHPHLDIYRAVDDNRVWDTMVLKRLHSLATAGHTARGESSLAACALAHLGVQLDKGQEDGQAAGGVRTGFGQFLGKPLKVIPPEYLTYLACDAIATWRLFGELYARIKEVLRGAHAAFGYVDERWLQSVVERFGPLTHHVQLKASIVMDALRSNGIAIDPARSSEKVRMVEAVLEGARERLRRRGYSAGEKGSAKAMQSILLEFRRLNPDLELKTTPTGKLSTTQEDLAELAPRDEFFADYIAFKSAEKLFSTYLGKMGQPRLHSRFGCLLKTGRTYCGGGFNLQNLPREKDEKDAAATVRGCFVPGEGNVFIDADYSQIELVVLGYVLQDQLRLPSVLAELVNSGQDVHRLIAARILGKEPLSVTDEERNSVKPVSFGRPGGMGVAGLRQVAKSGYGIDLTAEEVQQRIQEYHRLCPELDAFLRDEIDAGLAVAEALRLTPAQYRQATGKYVDAQDPNSHQPQGWLGGMLLKVLRERQPFTKVLRDQQPFTEKGQGRPYSPEEIAFFWDRAQGLLLMLEPEAAALLSRRQADKRLWEAVRDWVGRRPVFTVTGRLRADTTFCSSRNTLFQGPAADGAVLTLWLVWRAGHKIVDFVHDQLVVESPADGQVKDRVAEIERLMKQGMGLVLPGMLVKVKTVVTASLNKNELDPRYDPGTQELIGGGVQPAG